LAYRPGDDVAFGHPVAPLFFFFAFADLWLNRSRRAAAGHHDRHMSKAAEVTPTAVVWVASRRSLRSMMVRRPFAPPGPGGQRHLQ
jgi:hypothetical protein